MNIHQITQQSDGTFSATVTFSDGFTEDIEGLYDFESALAWTHMHNAAHATTGRWAYRW